MHVVGRQESSDHARSVKIDGERTTIVCTTRDHVSTLNAIITTIDELRYRSETVAHSL